MYESLERHLIHVSVSCAFIFKAIYYVENGLYAIWGDRVAEIETPFTIFTIIQDTVSL